MTAESCTSAGRMQRRIERRAGPRVTERRARSTLRESTARRFGARRAGSLLAALRGHGRARKGGGAALAWSPGSVRALPLRACRLRGGLAATAAPGAKPERAGVARGLRRSGRALLLPLHRASAG